ncbi:unnamed protein product [Boreogadus saida]
MGYVSQMGPFGEVDGVRFTHDHRSYISCPGNTTRNKTQPPYMMVGVLDEKFTSRKYTGPQGQVTMMTVKK